MKFSTCILSNRLLLMFLIVMAAIPVSTEVMAEANANNGIAAVKFPETVNHFISTYCISCHGPDQQKGKLRIDILSQDLIAGPHADDWHEVLDALNQGEMPPEDERQPRDAERNETIEILTAAFKEAACHRRSTGGRVVMRRLTNYEYNNTLNDLLALNENFSKDFPPDSLSEEGFKNNGFYMGMSALQIKNYVEAARRALDEAIFTGEQPELKAADIKNSKILRRSNGEHKEVKQKNIHGLLIWADHPRQGPVVLDVELSGADLDRVLGTVTLEAGKRLRPKGSPLYSFREVQVEPEISRKGDLVHLQYRIPRIEEYPLPYEDKGFLDFVFNLTAAGKHSLRVESMTAKGPYFDMWPPESHRRIFIPSANEQNEKLYAREIIKSFTARAWRRPVTDPEVDVFVDAYQAYRKKDSFVDSIKKSLVGVLVSPGFLYMVEPRSSSEEREKLSPYELASRLSYFLWSSMPDAALFRAANSGRLAEPDVLREEVRRMVQDSRSWNFVEQFTSQWLGLERVNSIAVSPELYPRFEEHVKDSLKGETQHFFAHILRHNESALNFIDSDFSFLNERLQKHYAGGMAAGGTTFKKVALTDKDKRGGLLAHGSIHLANSDGEDSHTISRGVWLVDRILGDPPPAPPADIELDKEIEGFDKMTLKEQLAAHVGKESCARCHVNIDPFGVAFENYDAVGVFRTEVRKIDQEELTRRMDSAKQGDPEVEFRILDKDNNGSLSQDEWIAYVTAKTPQKSSNPERLARAFKAVAKVGRDKEQSTHPPNSVSLDEYIDHVAAEQKKAIAGIQSNIPYRYVKVDASTQLPDATRIENLEDLKAYLLANRKNEFAENMVRRMLSYALGRSLEFSDDQTVQDLTRQFQDNGYKLATLVEDIVLCDPFQTK